MKKGIITLEVKNQFDAVCWLDEETEELSIEITFPWDGLTQKSAIKKLKNFLTECENHWDAPT